jgi:putative endonuclease
MVDARTLFGDKGELIAEEYLSSKGYKLVKRKYRNEYGEIDLICLDGIQVVFIEVKTRRSVKEGFPEESVTEKKIGNIIRCAGFYMDEIRSEASFRIDVISVLFTCNNPQVHHLIDIDIPEKFW